MWYYNRPSYRNIGLTDCDAIKETSLSWCNYLRTLPRNRVSRCVITVVEYATRVPRGDPQSYLSCPKGPVHCLGESCGARGQP